MSRVTGTSVITELQQHLLYKKSGAKYINTFVSDARGSVIRPDVKRNVRAPDGFRSPSSYSVITDGIPLIVPCGGVYKHPYATQWWEGSVAGSTKTDPQMSPALIQEAYKNHLRTKILINLKDEILDVAVLIAEMQGTTDLLVKGLGRIARSMDSLLRKKPHSFRYLMHGQKPSVKGKKLDAFNREVAGDYLEWKYGIMPTIMDVQGACEALDINEEGSLFANPALLVSRASLSGETSGEVSVELGNPAYRVVKVPSLVRWQAAARVDYSVDMEGIRGLNRYGLGLGTVGTVLLERTPFSFVLNMVFPIMDLVKAWTALAGCNVRGYSETFFVQTSMLGKSEVLASPGGLRVDIPKLQLTPSFVRMAGTSVPFPAPYIRNPIKVGNLATILALFTQLRSS